MYSWNTFRLHLLGKRDALKTETDLLESSEDNIMNWGLLETATGTTLDQIGEIAIDLAPVFLEIISPCNNFIFSFETNCSCSDFGWHFYFHFPLWIFLTMIFPELQPPLFSLIQCHLFFSIQWLVSVSLIREDKSLSNSQMSLTCGSTTGPVKTAIHTS